MKKALASILALAVVAAFAAPQFMTSSMRLRNGLTDAQYERLWSLGFKPSVDVATARDWVYRASRYENVTNWLAICGATNNFAALALQFQERANILAGEAAAMKTERDTYRAGWDTATNTLTRAYKLLDAEYAENVALSNRVASAEARAERVSAALDERRAEYVQKRDAAALLTTKAIYQAFIDAIDRIKEKIDGE